MKMNARFSFALLFSGQCSGICSPVCVPSDPLELLKLVSQHYAEAKSYHIETVADSTMHSDMMRSWNRAILVAAEDTKGRFHFEGQGGFGGALQIGDGTSIWKYRPDEHTYTRTLTTSYDPNTVFYVGAETQLVTAKFLRHTLADFSTHYKSATRLPDDSVEIDGRRVDCYVIRVRGSDQKRSIDPTYEETVWIDKTKDVFVKRESHRRISGFTGSGRITQDEESTTMYLVTEFDVPLPDRLFSFVPPPDAKLIDAFPSPTEGESLKGQLISELKLTSARGETFSPGSFRGKVLMLDLWATWCAPCAKGLEQLASVYKDGKDKGLVLVTIDQDEEAKTTTEWLGKKGYDWINVHDDGVITNALGGNGGIPRTIIVNREGKIVYDRLSSTEADIRKALAVLGPEFASLAPKPVSAPCPTQLTAATSP